MTTAPSDAPLDAPAGDQVPGDQALPGDRVPSDQVPGDATAPGDQVPAPAWRRRSVRRTFAATVLVLESLAVFFATVAVFGLAAAPPGLVWAVGGTLTVVLAGLAGALRRPAGYLAGSVTQGLVLAGAVALFAAPAQAGQFAAATALVVGLVFLALWVLALRLGGRIDREKAAWDAAHPDA